MFLLDFVTIFFFSHVCVHAYCMYIHVSMYLTAFVIRCVHMCSCTDVEADACVGNLPGSSFHFTHIRVYQSNPELANMANLLQDCLALPSEDEI